MKLAIKHKSGRVLFVTSDEFIADNRRRMGWIVEEVKMASREQFEKFIISVAGNVSMQTFMVHDSIYYKDAHIQGMWRAWQESRKAIEIEQMKALTTREALNAGYTADYATGVEHGLQIMEQAIESAGIKVKK